MPNKTVKEIQKLIDQNNPKRQLGRVGEVKISSFKYKKQNLLLPPQENKDRKSPVKRNNIVWSKRLFQFDRGSLADLTLQDFNHKLSEDIDNIVSDNGNIKDTMPFSNINAEYKARVSVEDSTVANMRIVAPRASISVYLFNESTKSNTRVFSSGPHYFYRESVIPLDLNQTGVWTVTILYYRQDTNGLIEITGDIGSYVKSVDGPTRLTKTPVTIETTLGISGTESKFVDSKNGPALSNIVYFNKLNKEADSFNRANLEGYGLYEIRKEKFDFTVVSGWGTNAFVIAGSKRDLFPIAGNITVPGPTSVKYIISGTQYDSNIDQTIVVLSGTTFDGVGSDTIYIERDNLITDLKHNNTFGQVISGIHFNVVAKNTYEYEVDTFNSLGERGPRSERVSVVAGDFTPPGLVTNLAASGTLKSVQLTWQNPSDADLKGIHIWDTNNVASGTDMPLHTLFKGSDGTVPTSVMVFHNSNGTLLDKTEYTFYASTFDWAGNEDASNMPSAAATTGFEVKTAREGQQRIELDSASNQLRSYNSDGNISILVGDFNTDEHGVKLFNNGLLRIENPANTHNVILDSVSLLFDTTQTDDPGTEPQQAAVYAKDNGGETEIYVIDGGGNSTLISPHNKQGEWEFFSRNKRTGKTFRVNMERFIRKMEEFTGETFIEE